MRVIAGTARSLPLKTVKGAATRPTTDRIKETLFNIIGPEVGGCRFLDLFSGSGAIGIEALSRGADQCVFVEQAREALAVIRENLAFTHLSDRAEIIGREAVGAVLTMRRAAPFHIIFMDPPYDKGLEKRILESLQDNPICDLDTRIIIEASKDTDFSYVEALGFEITKEKNYGSNRHLFLRRRE